GNLLFEPYYPPDPGWCYQGRCLSGTHYLSMPDCNVSGTGQQRSPHLPPKDSTATTRISI
ncbi:3426_t:CDS:1, partial [Dentiscutata erythropus]